MKATSFTRPLNAGRSIGRGRVLAVLLLILLVAMSGCSVREPRPEGAWLAERQAWFDDHPDWSVRGRLGLNDGERGGSLGFDWTARGDQHQVNLRTMAGGRQWRLAFGPDGAELRGSDVDTLRGPSADALVQEATGWPIPVEWMKRWLLGLPAPDGAALEFAEDGTLAGLAYRDWTLEFQRFAAPPGDPVLLPSKIEALKPPYRIRAALMGWSFGARSEPAAERADSRAVLVPQGRARDPERL